MTTRKLIRMALFLAGMIAFAALAYLVTKNVLYGESSPVIWDLSAAVIMAVSLEIYAQLLNTEAK